MFTQECRKLGLPPLKKCGAFMNSVENKQAMNKKSKSQPGLRALLIIFI